MVKEIIEFARHRGVRVVAEFNSPGDVKSLGKSIDILTECYVNSTNPSGEFGPIDPSENSTYTFLENFLGELTSVFKDQYIHLGGSELDYSCWYMT